MILNKTFITNALQNCSLLYSDSCTFNQVSIDSRTLQEGDFFVALSGSKRNGHEYVADALRAGASGCMIQEDQQDCLASLDTSMLKKKCIIVVSDVYQALGDLARAWRAQFEYPVVCITGSVGKTTVKNLVHGMLNESGVAHCISTGNQNTYVGLCLNIFKMNHEHKAAVFECGISLQGEMKKLAEIARPTVGVITNVGHSHMEGLGTLNDIAVEKRSLFSCFKEDDIGIVNGDQPLLASVGYPHPTVKFGTKTTNQIQARKIAVKDGSLSFVLKLYHEKTAVTLSDPHKGMVFNVLAAAACAHIVGCSFDAIIKSLENYKPEAGRFEKVVDATTSTVVINDTYNASPESMKEALLALESYDTSGRKIAVLGDMLELGIHSAFWHRQLGRFLRKVPSLYKVILVGTEVEWTKKTLPVGLQVEHVDSWQSASDRVREIKRDNDLVLVKGSRGMHLDKLVTKVIETAA